MASPRSVSCTSSRRRRPIRRTGLLLDLEHEVVQPHRLAREVLELDIVLLLVERDPGRVRHLALALAVGVESHLEEREGVVGGARLIDLFAEADDTRCDDDNAPAAV